MTSEEFAKRFQSHPLGHCFQNLEIADKLETLQVAVSVARGVLMLLHFQRDITDSEHEFLNEALLGNAQRNIRRLKKTNSHGTPTRQ